MEELQSTKKEEREFQREEQKKQAKNKTRMRIAKRVVLWLGVGLLLVGGVWAMIAFVPKAPVIEPGFDIPALTEADHVFGPQEAKVQLVEYGDFQCPACEVYYPWVHQLTLDFGDSLKFAYRQFPLRSIHAFADLASRASEAAGIQGKFWEMYDTLFLNQKEWVEAKNVTAQILLYAQVIGVDMAQFEKDLDSSDVKNKIETDLQGGNMSKIQGTPTFFLQGKRIVNPRNYNEFKSLIENALKQ